MLSDWGQKNGKATGGTPGIHIARPVGIGEDAKEQRGASSDEHTQAARTMQITQDTFHSRPVSRSRSMQELTDFVDRKRDIRSSKGEVLERPNHTVIICSII
jgi:hypothetical protein